MIRIVLADDHHIVRQGIRALLDLAPDIEVVGEADNGQDAITLIERLRPDVLLMDVAMPHLNGLEATARIRKLRMGTHVIMLSMNTEKAIILHALRAGARGYLNKSTLMDELLTAIRSVGQGEIYLSPALTETLMPDLLAAKMIAPVDGLDGLSVREREVLQLVAEGNTSIEIGNALSISTKTVEKHRGSLMGKLAVHDIAGLTRRAIKYGMVSADL